jgi:MarR family transcriptional regulator, lower aerobic nicotinate degradation pathway regulator
VGQIVAHCYYSQVPRYSIPVKSQRPPSLLALPSYLAGSVARLGNARLVAALAERGLKLPQYAVLAALADFGELAPHELANRLHTDRSHVSAFIDLLVKQELVRRDPHPTDRRRLIVTLTEVGSALTAELTSAAAAAEDSLLSALSERERTTLQKLLLKVIIDADTARSNSTA